MKRLFSIFLTLTLFLSLIPVSARAEETATNHETLTIITDPGLPDSEYLFSVYAAQVLYDLPRSNRGISAGSRLSGDTRKIYDAVVPILRQIADGQRKETSVSVGQTLKFGGKTYKPDVEVTFTGKGITGSDLRMLLTALLSDLPYELYWYDKTSGCSTEIFSGKTLLYVNLKFSVAENYRSGTYTVNTTKTAAASKAAANANHIVRCYADATDYNKLMGYSDAICDLADYDHAAADKGNYAKNNDPWQLIHIFDGDPNTKAVCEGYAKAYLYLCDLSDFQEQIRCHTVTGYANGAAHMWNIVTLDGNNYLTDVTNTDTGTRGSTLLLAGCIGSISKGYQVSRITYRYDSTTTNFWGTGSGSILNLSKSSYSPSWVLNHSHSYGSWETVVSANSTRIGVRGRTCGICGYVDSECSSTCEMEAPTLTLSADAASGKPKLSWNTVEGANAYRVYRATSKSGSFTRIKSTSSTGYTDTTATVGKNYYYKVIAVETESGTTSAASAVLNRVCDLPRPTVSLTVNTSTGKPVVKWETVEGACKYYIYRAEGDGSFSHVKTAISARSYEDAAAEAGISYSYKIRAVHENTSANSAYSKALSRVCDLPKPVVSVKLNSEGAPLLSWNEIDGAKNYRVYRSDSKSGEYTYLDSTTRLRYADRTAEAGTKYYYKVKAIHAASAASSAYSSAKSITVS